MARTRRVYVPFRAGSVTVGDVSINAGTMGAHCAFEMQLVRIKGKRVAGTPPWHVPDNGRFRVTGGAIGLQGKERAFIRCTAHQDDRADEVGGDRPWFKRDDGRGARLAVDQYPRERETSPVNGRPARNAATFCMAIGAADSGSVEAATWGSTVTCGSDQNGWSAGSGSLWKTSNTA
jgi:hypothetical protein